METPAGTSWGWGWEKNGKRLGEKTGKKGKEEAGRAQGQGTPCPQLLEKF